RCGGCEVVDLVPALARRPRVVYDRAGFERDVLARAGRELNILRLGANTHRRGCGIDFQTKVTIRMRLQMIPDTPHKSERVNLNPFIFRRRPRLPRRIPRETNTFQVPLVASELRPD